MKWNTFLILLLVVGLNTSGCATFNYLDGSPAEEIAAFRNDFNVHLKKAGAEEKALEKPAKEPATVEPITIKLAKIEPAGLPEETPLKLPVKTPSKTILQKKLAFIPFDDVYFDFDKYGINPKAIPVLKELSLWLIKNPARVIVEGHCDERGTNEYNLALGDRRAVSARNHLIARGVPPSRIATLSHGEERPRCLEHNEACWSKNRSTHFVIKDGK